MEYYTWETAVGPVTFAAADGALTVLAFGEKEIPGGRREATPLLRETRRQLAEYLAGQRKIFDLPLRPKGTEFQRRVWQALLAIPYGETVSYGNVAAAIGNPKACRAVGMANNRNPIAIVIPCHRVVGADGSLVGYGCGLEMKRRLLELEERYSGGNHNV